MSRWIFTLPLVFILGGCGYYHISKQKPDNTFHPSGKATLNFETIKSAVLTPYCLTCHSEAKAKPPKKPALETYAEVFANLSDIRDDVESGSMPDDGPLPPEQTQILLAWINAGAPLDSDLPLPGQKGDSPKPEPTPVPSPEKVTYQDVKARLFEPLCIQCHKSYGIYEKVIKRIDEIQAAVEHNEMPKDGPPVSDELKALLEAWIAQGLPEN